MKTDSKRKAVSPAEEARTDLSTQLGVRKFRGKVDWQGDLDAWRRDTDIPPFEISEEDVARFIRRMAKVRKSST